MTAFADQFGKAVTNDIFDTEQKYTLLKDFDTGLYRLLATKNFEYQVGGCTHKIYSGMFGGLVESENNLSQDGNCWIEYRAKAIDRARVEGNGLLLGKATAWGDAEIFGTATDNAIVGGNVIVREGAVLAGDSTAIRGVFYPKVPDHLIGGHDDITNTDLARAMLCRAGIFSYDKS